MRRGMYRPFSIISHGGNRSAGYSGAATWAAFFSDVPSGMFTLLNGCVRLVMCENDSPSKTKHKMGATGSLSARAGGVGCRAFNTGRQAARGTHAFDYFTGSTSTSHPLDVGMPVPSVVCPISRQVGGP